MAEIKGLTVKLGLDNSDFKKELKAADKEVRATQNTVKSLQDSLKIQWDSKKFEEAQRLAQHALDTTTSKTQKIKLELDKLDGAGVDKTSVSYQKLQSELIKTEVQVIKLSQSLEEVNNMKIDHLVANVKGLGDSISKAGKALMPFSAAAAGVLTGMVAMTNSAVKSASEIDDLSQMVNMNAESLQKWRYIIMQLGGDNSVLQNALTKTQAGFADLAMNVEGPTSKALKSLGFSFEDASKGMDENFEVMIQRLSQVSDASEQAALVNELFGDKLGSKLIPLLNGGAEGLAQLTKEFQELGYMTNEQINSLSTYDDQWNRIKTSMTAVKNDMAMAMLPVMQTITNLIQNNLVPAMRSLAEWFGGLSEGMRSFIIGALAVVAALAPTLLIVGKLTSGVGSLIGVIGKLHTSLGALSGIPVIAIIGVIAALLTTLYATNEQFRESINNLVGTLMSALGPILETISGLLGTLMQSLMPIIDILADILTPTIDMLATILAPLIQILQVILIPVMKQLEFMFQLIGVVLKPLTGAFKIFGEVFGWVAEQMGKAIDWIISNVINKGLSAIEGFVNGGIDMLNGMIQAINKLGGWLGISLKELDHISLQIKTSQETTVKHDTPKEATSIAEQAITGTTSNNNTTNITNTVDNSNKNINIEVVVQNYASEVDVDKLVRDINIKLAEGI